MSNSKKQILSGVVWKSVQMIVNQSFSFVVRLLLAKLLFPEEFGVVGMATVFTGFVQVLTELGIGSSIIQKKDGELDEKHFSTAFWTGVLWSVALFLVMSFMVAPLAAKFYNEPILITLIPVISTGILVSPINLVNRAQLAKKMDFKTIARIDNMATIFAGVLSLVLAYFGAGVWSLAFNSTATIVFAIPLYFKATGWYPKLIWDNIAFKELFGFGMFITATNIVNYLTNNLDYLIIGRLLNAELLGAYTLAFILTDTFKNRIMQVMNSVMYPFYGGIQDNVEQVRKYYLKVVEYNSIVVFPIMVFLVVYGQELVYSFWGAKWSETIDPLKILAVSVMFHMMVNSNTVLIRGLGYPKLEMNLQIFKAVIFVPFLYFFIHFWGIRGAAWAVLVNKVIAVGLAQYTFNRLINVKISTSQFLRALQVPCLASAAAFGLGYLVKYYSIHYIVGGGIMLLAYVLVVWLFMKGELATIVSAFRKKKQSLI
ncbi:lipopolysaccharide biosynthesis protein [Olivibacter jilunii]|uniref:lipopolysaccharide biosynthesis protein n=1 Tax=Olivibacter jilunii TaxID=985016 RepID=UPI003F1557C6